MKKYVTPLYEAQIVETKDIILASEIKDAGEATVGEITGKKGVFESLFTSIL